MNNWINPFQQSHILTSPFGFRTSPITGKQEFHNGVDVGTPMRTKIQMMFDGWLDIYIDEIDTKYLVMVEKGTNNRVDLLHVDEVISPRRNVKQGDIVGFTGNSGKYTTGAHTHIQFRKDWENNKINYLDPLFILNLPFTPKTMEEYYELFRIQKPGQPEVLIAHSAEPAPVVESYNKDKTLLTNKDAVYRLKVNRSFYADRILYYSNHLLTELKKAQAGGSNPEEKAKAQKYDDIKRILKELLS